MYLPGLLTVYLLRNFQQQRTQAGASIKSDLLDIAHRLLNLCIKLLNSSFIRVKWTGKYSNKQIIDITINAGLKIQDQEFMILKSQNQRILMQVVRIKFFNLKYQTAKKCRLKMQIQVLGTTKLLNLWKKRQKINKKKVLMANLLDLNHNHS